MTTIRQSRPIPVAHLGRPTVKRRLVDVLRRLAGGLRAEVRSIADAGQLGPDPETEIGRWTGSRV